MDIQRFHDPVLDHFSHLCYADGEAIVVDPGRKTTPYLDFLSDHDLRLVAIVMTHTPFAYASGWAELRRLTDCGMYAAEDFGFEAAGRFQRAVLATQVPFGKGGILSATPAPGFTDDSLCWLATYNSHKTQAVFTGGALLAGGVGYPYAEAGGDADRLHKTANELIAGFDERCPLYPAFGGEAHVARTDKRGGDHTNIATERKENPVFTEPTQRAFVDWLKQAPPFVPALYPALRAQNLVGFPAYRRELIYPPARPEDALTVDLRDPDNFHVAHTPGAINIPYDGPFALWLATVLKPDERFELIVNNHTDIEQVVETVQKLGREGFLIGVRTWKLPPIHNTTPVIEAEDVRDAPVGTYTIVDVRPERMAIEDTKFHGALNFPLATLRDRLMEVPQDRPIAVHCAGGYHSAIGASLLRGAYAERVEVFDMGSSIEEI